jgi:hypothetical protein
MVATIKAANVGPRTSVRWASAVLVGTEKVAIGVGESRYPNVIPIPEPTSGMYEPSKQIKNSLVSRITRSGDMVKGKVIVGCARETRSSDDNTASHPSTKAANSRPVRYNKNNRKNSTSMGTPY